jgi:hypothetical protein
VLTKKTPDHWSLVHSELAASKRRPKRRSLLLYRVDIVCTGRAQRKTSHSFSNRLCAQAGDTPQTRSIRIDAEGYTSPRAVERLISSFVKEPHEIRFLGTVSGDAISFDGDKIFHGLTNV